MTVARKQYVPLPDTVRVFGREYQLRADKPVHGGEWLGECDNNLQVICIDPIQGPAELVDSVIHEVLHAIFHTMRIGIGDDLEEKVVTSLATGLVGVLQDNPQLAQWIIQQRDHKGVK